MSKILVFNHKMFLTFDEAMTLKNKLDKIKYDNIIVAASYLNLSVFKNYDLCAQDAFYEDKGAYTGRVSAYQLSKINVKYSLVGHADLRLYDDDKIINLKIKSLLKNNIIPILCIGETKEEKSLNKTLQVLEKQLLSALDGISDNSTIYIGYEPNYLIGKNTVLKKDKIEDIFTFLREILKTHNIKNYKLLYGASVNGDNIDELMTKQIDGFLIGNASTDINEIKKMVECINKCKEK